MQVRDLIAKLQALPQHDNIVMKVPVEGQHGGIFMELFPIDKIENLSGGNHAILREKMREIVYSELPENCRPKSHIKP